MGIKMADIYKFKVSDEDEVLIRKNWFLGTVKIFINGKPLKTKIMFIGGIKKIEFKVDQHDVTIAVNIPLFAPAFRKWCYLITVNGNDIKHICK